MAAASLPPESRLVALAGELGLTLDVGQCAQLLGYAQLLRRWNRVHNLTSVDTPEEVLTHHLLDCLAIVPPLDAALQAAGLAAGNAQDDSIEFLDAGSGAGLPGIPLAIARPRWRGWLVDAVEKKCAFLRQATVELSIGNVQVRHARLESVALPRCALVVSRAFASLRDFVALTRAHVAPGGLWAAMKGPDVDAELRALARANTLGVERIDTITLRVPLLDEQRRLVIMHAPATVQEASARAGRRATAAGADNPTR